MATYGSRDKNRFKITGSNSEYYTLVDSKTGTITVKSPNVGGGILDRTVGTIEATGSKAKKFQSTPGSTTTDEETLFSNQTNTNTVRNQAIITATKAQIELGLSVDDAKARSNQLINTGTTTTAPVSSTAPPPTPPEGGANVDPFEAPNIEEDREQSEQSFGNWAYPTDIRNNEQDFINFTMIEYVSKPLAALKTFERFKSKTNPNGRDKKILGTVSLPIQPSITDTNTVDWQQEGINPLQSAGARLALSAASSDPSTAVPATINNLIGEVQDQNETFKNYLKVWAAGQAVGVNLLSRVSGAVVNPNMELLFNGPQLRAFNFSFRLSPRDDTEAKQVKNIIRFFKQGMAVRTASKGVFLKSPNIFDIQYCFKNTDTLHPALSQIKTCALTSCTVDYTPDGSYMTFDEGTMTSYNLTLQFSELEPIYDSDYEGYPNPDKNKSQISY